MTAVPNAETRRPLLDIAGVAEYLATSERHIRRLVAERRMPYVKVGGLVRFNVDAVDRWLESNERRPVGSGTSSASSVAPVRSLPRRRSAQTVPKPPKTTQLRLGD